MEQKLYQPQGTNFMKYPKVFFHNFRQTLKLNFATVRDFYRLIFKAFAMKGCIFWTERWCHRGGDEVQNIWIVFAKKTKFKRFGLCFGGMVSCSILYKTFSFDLKNLSLFLLSIYEKDCIYSPGVVDRVG